MAKLGPSFADKIVTDLLCPSCQGYLLPPIVQCVNGHCICQSCRQRQPHCSICRQAFTNVRCRPLEALAEHYHIPCSNSCGQKVRLINLKDHEASCTHRKFPCKIAECTWRGVPSDLACHVAQKHPTENIVPGKGYFSTKWDGCHVKLATLDNKVMFWYYLIQDNSKPKYFRAFQYIGPVANAQNFEYSFGFNFPDNPITVMFKRPAYSIEDNIVSEYESDVDFHQIFSSVKKRYKKEAKIPCLSSLSRVKLASSPLEEIFKNNLKCT